MHMDMSSNTSVGLSNDGMHGSDNGNDKNHSMDTQQDIVGVNNPNMPELEDQMWAKNMNCHRVSLVVGQK